MMTSAQSSSSSTHNPMKEIHHCKSCVLTTKTTNGGSGTGFLTLHHHSLDPYNGGHEMVPSNSISVAQEDLEAKSCQLFAISSPKCGMAWHRWELRNWFFDTASSLIGLIHGGHGMVQQHHILSIAFEQHQCCPRFGG
jgi:hypothetical protein